MNDYIDKVVVKKKYIPMRTIEYKFLKGEKKTNPKELKQKRNIILKINRY